jgi:hypothetical protein
MTRCTRMHRVLPLVFVVLLTSCAERPPSSAQSAKPASTASPSTSSGIPTCQISVSRPQFQPGNPNLVKDFVGGFLQLPSGQYTDDANSLASLDPAAPVGGCPAST